MLDTNLNRRFNAEIHRRSHCRSCHFFRATLFFLSVLALLLFLFSPSARADAPPHPIVLRADATGVTLRWEFPRVTIAEKTVDGQQFSVVMMDGFPAEGNPGAPSLPRAATLIGLPPTGNGIAVVTTIQTETIALPAPPLPAPAFNAVGNPPQSVEIIAPDSNFYEKNNIFPAEWVVLDVPQKIRFQRVARLTVNPVRANAVARTAIVLRGITVRVDFSDPAADFSARESFSADPIARALMASLVNPQSAQWQTPRIPQRNLSAQTTVSATKIIVSQPGITTLTCADLQAAGFSTDTLDPRKLQMTTGYPRRTVAIQIAGESDGYCDPADRLLFFAEPTFSRYTDDGAYFLTVGTENGTRMAVQSGNPTGLPSGTAWFTTAFEINRVYEELYADHSGDHFFWQKLNALPDNGVPQNAGNFTLTVPHSPIDGTSAGLTVYFQGTFDSDHHVQVTINGHAAGEAAWNGKTAYVFSANIPAEWLHAGANTLSLTLTDAIGDVWFDAAAARYAARPTGGQFVFSGDDSPRAYVFPQWQEVPVVLNVTHPLSPTIVSGAQLSGGTLTIGDGGDTPARYAVSAATALRSPVRLEFARTLTDPPGGADYIIITHPDFAAAVAPLAAHRASQGLRVATVDVRAIYDTFGDGRVSAAAIKTFLTHAFSNWAPPAPTYVLLVGDGHYDFKNYLGWNVPNFIPPYLVAIDPRASYPWVAETAADNRYVTLTGGDNFPDMLIGRLPVNSAAEAQTVVDKILQYETHPFPGNWREKQLLVSDNCDVAGNFYNFNDVIYDNTSSLFSSVRFYYPQDLGAQCAYTDTILYGDIPSLRYDFLQAFKRGAGVITFAGHSSWHQWAGGNRTTGAEESVFHWSRDPAQNDILQLTNGYQLPIVLGMTCFTGYFHHPEYPTLDESMLRRLNGGAVAVWGATGVGVATGHTQLEHGFYDALTERNEREIGAAVMAGKAQLFADGFNQDLLDTFTLLGDPAFTMNFTAIPFTDFVYLPLVFRDSG